MPEKAPHYALVMEANLDQQVSDQTPHNFSIASATAFGVMFSRQR